MGHCTMRRVPTLVALPAVIATFCLPAAAQDLSSQIVGIWRIKKIEQIDVASKATSLPFGDRPTGFYIFTKAGRYIKGSSSGTYKTGSGKVIITYDGPTGSAGDTLEREVQVTGNVMLLTSEPSLNRVTGRTAVFTVTAERVE